MRLLAGYVSHAKNLNARQQLALVRIVIIWSVAECSVRQPLNGDMRRDVWVVPDKVGLIIVCSKYASIRTCKPKQALLSLDFPVSRRFKTLLPVLLML